MEAWRSLRAYWSYQLLLATLFIVLVPLNLGPPQLGRHDPALYWIVSPIYLGAVLTAGVFLAWRRPAFPLQAVARLLLDIVAITLIMHASGGVTSGLGTLTVVTIAVGGILIGGRCALALAALASLCVLGEQVYAHLHQEFSHNAYSNAGILGLAYLASALIAYQLSLMAEHSQNLALQHSFDLASLEQLNAYIIEHMQSGILIVDHHERLRLMNASAQRMLGLGRQPAELRDACPVLCAYYRQWLRSPEHDLYEISKPNQPPVQVRMSRHDNPAGALHILLLEDSDLHNQRVQQSKLASLYRLTASIAHELRNPLSAVRQASQLLAETDDLEHGSARLTAIIQRNCARINEIIESILMLSRRSPAHGEALQLREWLEQFATDFQFQQQLPTHSSLLLIEIGAEVRARFDPGQLRQILDNLCSNALKYGRAAEHPVLLRVDRLSSGEPVIEVRDRGPGIRPEDARHLFEPFFTTSTTGTGLGLYISRELAELNQGRLEYLPNPEGGSCFRLTIPDADRQTIAL